MSGNPNLQPVKQPGKRRKKHPPDRQQPEWLFPADEENPALKPHKEPTAKEKLEKQRSIDFLTRRAVGAPMKPAPPIQLLNLIGAFLAEYGFTSTGRLFSTERQGRSRLDGWKNETGEKLEKGMPTLGKIYKEWRTEWDERRLLDMTSSDEEDDAATKREKMLARREKVEKQKNKANDDATSSSGSSTTEDSDTEMKDAPPAKKMTNKRASSSSGSSSSSTSSDSDADDEQEATVTKTVTKNSAQKSKSNTLKRKASLSSSSSASESGSSSSEGPKSKKAKTKAATDLSSSGSNPPLKKGVQAQKSVSAQKAEQSSSDSSSDSSSGSESESPSSTAAKTPLPESSGSDSSSDSESDSASDADNKGKPPISSDTSATLSDGPKRVTPVNSGTDSSSNGSVTDPKNKAATAKGEPPKTSPTSTAVLPHKTNVPFSRIPKDIKIEPKLASNAYVPYDYAQKAHEDLIVTKGKGFTREKNKKKKGSYKGGYIDVEGKKGIKFEE